MRVNNAPRLLCRKHSTVTDEAGRKARCVPLHNPQRLGLSSSSSPSTSSVEEGKKGSAGKECGFFCFFFSDALFFLALSIVQSKMRQPIALVGATAWPASVTLAETYHP